MSGLTAVKVFKVAWKDRMQFYLDVIGHVYVTGGLGGTVTRRVPLQYPDIPQLYASSFSMEPWGKSRQGYYQIEYDWAKITVGFQTVPWNFQGSDDPDSFTTGIYRSESLEMGGEIMQFPASAYKYETAPPSNKILQPVGRIVPTANLSITLFQAPYIPYADIFALIGSVNVGPFYGADPQTVLFMGGQSEAETNMAGIRTQRLTFKFSYRAIPWSVFLLPDGSGFDRIVQQGTGDPLYPLGNFDVLLF